MFSKIKNIKKRSLLLGLVLLVMMLLLGYSVIIYAEKQVKDNALEALRPLQQACHESDGCFSIPKDWIEVPCTDEHELAAASVCASPPQTSAYHGLIYRATPDQFIARWRYVIDTELVIRGGRGKALSVEVLKIE